MQFEDDLLGWKKQFGLPQRDWLVVEPQIREMMKYDFLPEEIVDFLAPYKAS